MKLEILYPELTGLYGDTGNIRYLLRSLPGAERVDTHLGQTPLFATQTPALIVLGPMSERGQAHVLRELQPWRDRLGELIEGGARFLCTGNAFELFGQRVECRPAPGEYTGGTVLEGLALLDFYAVRDLGRRYNGFFLGRYGQIPVTGFNSRFSHAYPGPGLDGLFSVTRGIGLHEGCPVEGVRKNGFFGTYLLGPLLPLNPALARDWLAPLGGQPAFEAEAEAAFARRLAEFSDPKRHLD